MTSQVSEISPVIVEVSVEVPWDDVKKELTQAYGKLGKTARVRGFRPGKVPRSVLQKLYSPQVHQEVLGTLFERSMSAAVEEHEIPVVAMNEQDELPKVKQGEPLAFKAKLEVRPTIDKVELEGIELTREQDEVGDEQVNAELEKLRENNAELAEPDPMRPAKEGDVLTCSYTVALDGEARDDMTANDRPIELGEDLMPEWRENLLGKSPGDTAEFDVTFPEEAGDLANKTGAFKVEIKELKEKLLPDLDDELAKDVGEHETLDALKKSIEDRLTEAAKNKAESALKDALVDKLIEKNPIELPPSLVQQQTQGMLQEYIQILQMTGQQPNMGDNFMDDMKERAEHKVRAALLFGAIAKQQEIKVLPEDVDARLEKMAESQGKHIAKVKAEMQGEQREMLESQILEEKLLEYLLEQATITGTSE